MDRRDFLKSLGAGALATAAMAAGCKNPNATSAEGFTLGEVPTDKMTYRQGTHGEKVSLLGYGCMRLPSLEDGKDGNQSEGDLDQDRINELTDYAIEHGLNLFDTAPRYCKARSEIAMGKALSRHRRDEYLVSTKLSNQNSSLWNFKGSKEMFEQSLERLQVDYLDFYMLHCVGLPGRDKDGNQVDPMEAFQRRFVDSGMIESKAKESAFAGYTVRFKDHPNMEFEGLQWETVLDKTGWGEIGNRIGFLAYFNQKGILELVSPKGEVVRTIKLKNIKAGYTTNGSRKDVDNYINIAPPQVAAIVVAGNVYCSSSTYNKGEKKSMSPILITTSMIPGAIDVKYEKDRISVKCPEILEDEDENVYVGTDTWLSFDIENPEDLETDQSPMKNLFFNSQFSFSSGDDLMYEESCRMNVSSVIPMKPGTLYPDAADEDDSRILAYLGGQYGKTWYVDQSSGLKFSSYTITRKDYVYEWDREARKDVLDHIDTHNFSLLDDPGNKIQIIVLFK